MPTVTIDITCENLEELIERLRDAIPFLEERIRAILVEAGFNIMEDARINAPEKTGRLKNSIHAVPTSDGCDVVAAVPYASYQEFGTSKIVGKHFMGDALAAQIPTIRAEIVKIIREAYEQ